MNESSTGNTAAYDLFDPAQAGQAQASPTSSSTLPSAETIAMVQLVGCRMAQAPTESPSNTLERRPSRKSAAIQSHGSRSCQPNVGENLARLRI